MNLTQTRQAAARLAFVAMAEIGALIRVYGWWFLAYIFCAWAAGALLG
jgi:hypothetical protein